jgi:hypothetical protein
LGSIQKYNLGLLFRAASLFPVLLQAGALPNELPFVIGDPREIYEHRILPDPVVLTPWTDITKTEKSLEWNFELTIDTRGSVVAATLKSGAAQLRAEATLAARTARFKPFLRGGQTVPARLAWTIRSQTSDYVGPGDRNFPQHTSPETTAIALLRTSCLGLCPHYRVEILGSGEVTYRGDYNVLVKGTHHWHIDAQSVSALVDRFRNADYFKLKGYYELSATDLPAYITSLSIGAQKKFVLDYGGSGLGGAFASTSIGGDDPHMPRAVTGIEDAIDQLSGVLSWVEGDTNTVANLRAAHWDFHSADAGRALDFLISDCKTSVAQEFMRLGAPINIRRDQLPYGPSVVAAAQCGDVQLVRTLEAKGALRTPEFQRPSCSRACTGDSRRWWSLRSCTTTKFR